MKPVPMPDFGSGRLRIEGGRLLCDWSGAPALVTGLATTEIIGFAGFGIDVENWVATQHNMQGTADQADYSAAVTYGTGGGTSPTTQAKSVAASFGFVDGTGEIYAASQEVDYTGSAGATSGWSVVERPRWAAPERSMRRCRYLDA
jgi:Flp pilus assembly protein TadG